MSKFTHAQKVHALEYARIAFGYMRRWVGGSAETANVQQPIFEAALEEYSRQEEELREAYGHILDLLNRQKPLMATADVKPVDVWLYRNSHLKPS